MQALDELKERLEGAETPESLLLLYRDAATSLEAFESLVSEVRDKLTGAMTPGEKFESDIGVASWAKARASLDKDAWAAAKTEDKELQTLEDAAKASADQLKKAKAPFMVRGDDTLRIKLAGE